MVNGLLWTGIVVLVLLVGVVVYAIAQNDGMTGDVINEGMMDEPDSQTENGGSMTHVVLIEDFDYDPRTITINVGDTVIWTNMDSVGHTVTSDSGSELDSVLLGQGESYSHTFTNAGTYDYHCIPHPNMMGSVVVVN